MLPAPLLALALAGPGAGLAPEGGSYVGTAFARGMESTLVVVNPDQGLLQPFLAFEGSCRGDRRVGSVWASNLRTRRRLRLGADGSFDATLSARRRGVGPIEDAMGVYTWRLRGRVVDATTLTARISGSLQATEGRRTVLRCSAPTPAALVLALVQPARESSTRLPSGSRR